MGWSDKYKKSIDCNNPKGFSQRAHCQGKKKKVNEENAKRCKVGYYYCFTEKKCKKIPIGYHVGRGGYLAKDNEDSSSEDNKNGKKNGNGSNGNGSNGNGSNGGNGGGMSEELNADDKPFVKKLVGKLRKGSKTHAKQADDLEKAMKEESNPRIPRKKGQPSNSKKHSDLYTDENPKGTIHGLGFKDVATAKASVTKIKNSSRSHAHKIQAAVAMEQRAREMGKTAEAAVYRKFINSMKEKTKKMNEGTLHKWFKGSKSKDGKGGWVNVVTGGTCASDEPGEGTPKCVSSAKRASMTKAERLSAARRKKKADPGQQQKTGAAKPTYVSTDPKKKMKEEAILETKDKKGKGSGKKDACYHKVKSRYSVWPSAYASGELVKCRKVGAANWGNKSEEVDIQEKKKGGAKKCWPGYKKVGTQKLFGKTYNRCVKASYEVDGITFKKFRELSEGAAWTKKSGKNPSGGLNEKGRKSYERENPGSDLKAPSKKVGNKRRASFCARMKGMKAKLTSAKTARDPDSRINKSLRAWNC